MELAPDFGARTAVDRFSRYMYIHTLMAARFYAPVPDASIIPETPPLEELLSKKQSVPVQGLCSSLSLSLHIYIYIDIHTCACEQDKSMFSSHIPMIGFIQKLYGDIAIKYVFNLL